MRTRYTALLVLAGALHAQQTVSVEPSGSARGDNTGAYNITQSFELGYRWSIVDGDRGMYRSTVNFGNGIRLLGSSLTVNSREGHGKYFDEILLNTQGLGNDPYQNAVFRIQKNGLYRYDLNWRSNAYYNPGLTIAAGAHFKDTARRLQDHDLTLLPQSKFRFRVGYSRNKEDGPALITSQEFDANGFGLPVFQDVRRDWNEYRVGFDVDYRDFKFTLTRRWNFFKEDSAYNSIGTNVSPVSTTDRTVLQQFARGEPLHGTNHGWLGNLFARRKLWGVNARMTYVSGARDFVTGEFASGIGQFGNPANRVIVAGGRARRPVLAGDASISLYPNDRLTIVNNTAVVSNRIDGDSRYTEYFNGSDFGTTINFRYLGIRTVANSTDINYRVRPWVGFYGSYRFTDRQIRAVQSFEIPQFPDSGVRNPYEVSNRLHTGVGGVRLRPVKPLTFNLEGEVGRAEAPLTAVALRDYHAINGRIDYRTKKLQLSTGYRQLYNLNAGDVLNAHSAHSRNYSANASWTPRDGFGLDLSYTKLHLDSSTGMAFFASTGTRPQLQTQYLSYFQSNVHAANLGAHFTILRRGELYAAYSITRDTGGPRTAASGDPIQAILSSVQSFPMTYQTPLVRLSIRITPKLRWNAGYQYYGYNQQSNPFGFFQNFHANNGYTSMQWSF